ncbi:DUF7507 domain-containing protein [Macrococcus animalis]|uniref:DUF7507 domain-containing protein n=1 Tax=Macrococcus animalis TaxID=3395467 RepID=UPI0039BE23AF
MENLKRLLLVIMMMLIGLPLQSFININETQAATSGVPPAACTKTLTGTSSVPKVTLSPKPLDLVFILDSSGSFTANMPKVKTMITTAIDKYVQPADGDRTMVTTFQGVKDNIYQSPVGTNYDAYTEGNFKITTNSSKLTSDITSVKNFVNAVTPSGGTPTPSGVTQALNDYKSIAGTATDRQTVFVLITDGVVNVNPKTGNVEKNATFEQAYVDNFKSVSTAIGTYYDSYLGVYYTQYRWARYNAVTGAFIRYEYINDYPGTVNDQFYNPTNGVWDYIYPYETSQDWKSRLNDLTAATTSLKTAYPNAELVVGFLEDRNAFSNMNQYGPLYESTMRPQIQTALQSYATEPSYYINTGDPTAFVNQLSAAISNAVQSVTSTGTFTLTDGYKMSTMTLINKTTGARIPLTFTQNGTTITVNQFDYDGSDYSLEFTTELLDPDKLIIDADPSADEIGPILSGDLTIGTQKVAIPKFGPSAADTYQYFNCETSVKKSVKKATETAYKTPSTTLDSGTQTFTFSNDYLFNRSPLAWSTSPILYDKIDPRLEILAVKVIARDRTGALSVPFTLGSSAITTTNNEVKVTLPPDADGKFTSYLSDQYKVLITAKIKPEFAQDGALYDQIVANGIPNQAEIITTISGTTTKQSLISNEVKVFAPDQNPLPVKFQKNGVLPDGTKKGIPGAEFKLTPVTTYEDATGKIVQVNNGTPVTATSGANGQVITPDVMPGVYILEETKAPPGYTLDATKRKLTVNSDGTYTVVTIDASGNEVPAASPLVIDNKQQKTSIDLVKTSNVSTVTKAGDVVTYTFKVTNTGEVALYNVKVDDPMFGAGITLDKTTLNPGETAIGTISKTITQNEINAGDIINTAVATGTPPGDLTPPKDTDKVTITTPDTPAITLDKAADKTTVKQGDVVTYNFKITNTGNVTLTNVTLNDPMLGGTVSVQKTTLLPGESTTGTAIYKITEKDVANATIVNTATVSGKPPVGTDVTSKDTETITPKVTPGITLDKVSENALVTQPGQTINYRFTVTNTGDATLTNVVVTDPMFPNGINLAQTTLAPGESTIGIAEHIVTLAEFDSGKVSNTAKATGTPPSGTPPISTDTVDVPTELIPTIKLEKNTTATSVKEGDKVTYNFVITNTGNTTLNNVKLTDPMLGGNVTILKTTLAPGETTTGSAVYTVTTADMSKDNITNTAKVDGTDPKGTTVSDDDEVIVTPDGKPGINLDKSTAVDNVSKAGDIIDYQFKVTNTGDTTLTNVTITDPMFASGVTLAKTTLAPGETTTGTAKHIVTQDEINNGEINNKAVVTGTPPSGEPPTSSDEVTVPAIGTATIDLTKKANVTEIKKAGELVTYTFTVTNTGTTTLTDVRVTDPLFSSEITLAKTSLNPGETTTGTATYSVKQSDLDKGNLPNTAFVIGDAPMNLEDPTDTDSVTIPAVNTNGIDIVKTSSTTEITAPGQTVTYNFVVTNTGTTTLTDVRITDPMFPNGGILTNRTIAPGESTSGTAIHTVTQEEFDSGKLVNIATTTGTPPSGTPPTDTDTVEIPTKPTTSITLDKSAGQTILQQIGEVVVYTFEVTNTGTSTLTNVKLTDPMFPEGISLQKTSLLPGETTIATASRTITQDDLNKASLDNIATVTGTPPAGLTPPTATDNVTIPTERKPEIELHKHADIQDVDHVGQVITYELEIFNTGNVTLTNIELVDPMFGGVIKLDTTTLQPGETTKVQLEHVVTQAEFDSRKITNTAKVTGVPPEGPPVSSEETEIVNTMPSTAIALDKTSDVTSVTQAGDIINYTFVITNTGTSTLTDVSLNDAKLGGAITLKDTVLAPGASTTITKSYTVTQEDINSGEILNTAATTGTPPAGLTPPTATDDNKVVATGNPAIEIVKTVNTQTYKLGDTLIYKFVITNTGNVTLTDVNADDLFVGQHINLDKTILQPGETTTATMEYEVTQADVDRGNIRNQAVVEGTPPGDLEPPFDDDDVTVTTDRSTSITLDKSADLTSVKVGDTITYTFDVKNTGTTTLTDVEVNDPMFPEGITLLTTTLKPGESTTGTATKVVTQEDIDGGKVTNTATTTGTPPGNLTPPTATDTVEVPTDQQAAIDLEKTSDVTSAKVGDTITYTFTVTNTGTVTLKDVKVTDAMFPEGITLATTTLKPGETTTGTASKVVTQEDIDGGKVTNTATTTGTPPGDTPPPTDEDTVEVPTNPATSISIDKTTTATGLVVGEAVDYTFTVTNTGNVTLKDVIVTDPMFGGNITLGKTTLLPGEVTTGTASHIVTQEEVDAGKLSNTALTTGTPPGDLTPPTAEDTVVITQDGSTAIALDKSADLTSVKVGDTITYTFDVKNTGTTTLTNVVVNDPMFPEGITLLTTTLKPGESTTGTATKVVTQEDIDGGKVTNTATTTGTPPGNLTPPTATDTVEVPTDQQAAIDLEKTSDVTSAKVGDTITYTFTVTNTGTVTLKDVKVTDAMFPEGITLATTTLKPGETTTGTASKVVTQEDIDGGKVTNTATTTGTPPGDTPPPTDEDTVEVPTNPATSISIDKTTTATGLVVGEAVDYTFTVTNTGNVTLKDVIVTDPMFGGNITLGKTTLLPGEVTTGTASHIVTQEEVDAGKLSNTALTTGTPPGDLTPPTAEDTVVITQDGSTAIALDKSADLTSVKVGDTITYTFDVKNTGTTTLTNVVVNDPMFPEGITLLTTTLKPGESTTGTATKVVTQEDIDGGKVTNTATTTGTPPGNLTPPTATDTVEVPTDQQAAIDLEKTSDVTSAKVGDTITYTFTVTNTGTVTLKDVKVTDAMFPEGITLATTTLKPGETTTGTASKVVTQEDIDGGKVTNTATTTGTPPGDTPPPTDEDTVEVPTNPATSISIDKTTTATGLVVGEAVDYTFTVTNTGNVTLKDVIVTDPMFGGNITLGKTTLLPGEVTTGTASHIVTQEEVDAGKLSNTALTTGTPPGDLTPPTAEDTVVITQDGSTAIALDKSADLTSVKVGDTITYTFDVKNTGTTTLTNVVVNDPMFPEGITLLTTTLKPGESTTGTATKVVTQEDIDGGKVTNTATTTGTPPGNLTPPTATDTVEVPTDQQAAIDLEKTSDVTSAKVGDTITYTFTVTNTGTVTLKDVKVTDAMFPEGITLATTTLKPGETTTGTASKVVTQEDIDGGKVTNTATTTGTPPGDTPPPTDEDTVEVPTNPATSISIDKTTTATGLVVGEAVDYTFTVTNTGNVPLKDVIVTDPMFGGNITLGKTTLLPGEVTTGTASHIVTQEEVDAGKLSNTALTTGTPPGDLTPPTAEDTVVITQDGSTAIALDKSADLTSVKVGDTITYTFDVKNTGTTTLTNVVVNDPMFPEGITLLTTTLKPGESTTGTATKVVTQEDIDGGKVTNTATTTGTPPGNLTPPTATDTVEVPTDQQAAIDLEKTSDVTSAKVGDTITYTFTVTNTGTVTLKDVKVTDAMFPEGITLATTTLKPGETTTGTASKVVTQEDIDGGKVTNTATTTGTPPGDTPPPTDEDTVEVPTNPATSISIDKTTTATGLVVGEAVDYTFTVTNTGNVTLKDVIVTDPMFGGNITLGKTTLLPGEVTTGTASHIVTQEEVDAGKLSNTALTTGTPPGDLTPPTAEDTVVITQDGSTAIALDKSADLTSVKVGDTITYTFDVKNTGTTTLTNVVVNDPMFPEGITLLTTTLKPGESTTGTATKVVTQEDIDGGKVTNTATTTGTPPGNLTPPTATDTVEVPTDQQAAIDLEKTSDVTSAKVGDTITYTFTVTNTGTVTLKDVKVTDAMFPEGITLATTTLKPGETTTGTASKVVTQEDIDGGKVTNTATTTGTPPGDTPPPTDEDTVEVPTNPATSISIDKTTTATGLVVGEAVDYTFTVTNTGNVTLKDVIVTDPMFGGNITLGKTTLLPGEVTTGTASHIVTQEEVDAGKLSNTALTTGTPPGDLTPPTAEDTVVITQDGSTAIALDKSADLTSVKVGDTITYTFDVKNTGTTTLTNVVVNDPMFPEGITLLTTTLKPGESTTGTATKVVTQEDIDGGKVTNTATTTGTPPGNLTPPTATDTVDVPVEIVIVPTTEGPTTEEPTTELPTTEEPTTEGPTTEEPTTELPTTEEPTTEGPTTEEPTTEGPTTELPTTEEPTTEEPTTEEPTTELPTTEGPTTEGPTTEGPTTEGPTTEGPTTEEPTTELPTTEEPTTETYSISDLVWNDVNQDGIQDANEGGLEGINVILTKPDGTKVTVVTDKYGHYIFTGLENGVYTIEFVIPDGFKGSPTGQSTPDKDSNGNITKVVINNSNDNSVDMGMYEKGSGGTPTTELPTTELPTTEVPTTEEPTTEVPTTEGATTEEPTTELPTTEGATAEEPTTELPTTEVPTTEGATTEEPTTEAPTTEEPTTELPTTEVPTTEGATTEEPTTEAPTTEEPTTEGATTEEPTTEEPTTEAPTTEGPTTEAPTTEAPTTETPTTETPTTEVPTTELPTTELPTTEEPTTEVPTIEIPEGLNPIVTPVTKPAVEVPNKPTLPEDNIVNIIPKGTEDDGILPDTGEALKHTGLVGLMFLALGGLLLVLPRRKN